MNHWPRSISGVSVSAGTSTAALHQVFLGAELIPKSPKTARVTSQFGTAHFNGTMVGELTIEAKSEAPRPGFGEK